jgi:hypothetical protein
MIKWLGSEKYISYIAIGKKKKKQYHSSNNNNIKKKQGSE